ncbi:MAG: MbtH family NRPS accessory protein [Nannocystaceae bacterium]|nr:MbtH family NRPS accessory protein [Nannocystaceae bacterium]
MTDSTNTAQGQEQFCVVINLEEQYSIWKGDRDIPGGWRTEGTTGTRDECLDHIERVWVDMRPKSVREHMARLESAER